MKNTALRPLLELAFSVMFALVCTTSVVHAQQTCNSNMTVTAPSTRFVDHGDGTVSDTQTGLIWAKCKQGLSGAMCSAGAATTHTWSQALALSMATSDTTNASDWRLPNIKELGSLVELSCQNPAINESVFPNAGSSIFWSASPRSFVRDGAWGVSFGFGNTLISVRRDEGSVRLVRGGQ